MSAKAATRNSNEPTPLSPVKVRVDLPAPIYDQFLIAASAVGRDVEEFIADHLRQTVAQDHTGAGIWFSAEDAKKLCRFTGRGTCTDAPTILNRLEPLLQVLVGDVIVELDAQVLDRLKHIGKRSVPEFIRKEALNGIRSSLGLGLR